MNGKTLVRAGRFLRAQSMKITPRTLIMLRRLSMAGCSSSPLAHARHPALLHMQNLEGPPRHSCLTACHSQRSRSQRVLSPIFDSPTAKIVFQLSYALLMSTLLEHFTSSYGRTSDVDPKLDLAMRHSALMVSLAFTNGSQRTTRHPKPRIQSFEAREVLHTQVRRN